MKQYRKAGKLGKEAIYHGSRDTKGGASALHIIRETKSKLAAIISG